MKKLIKLTSVVLISALFLSGCQKILLIPGKTTAPDESTSDSVSSSYEEIIKDFPVTLNGTEITKAVEKIVSLTPAYTEILCEMGYGDSIVGVCDYCSYPDKVSSLQTVGSSTAPDIAKIISLKPDLVITATPLITKDRIALEAKGIKLLTITSPKTVQEFQNVYKFIGLAYEGLLHGEDKGLNCFKPVQDKLNEIAKLNENSFIYISPTMTLAGTDTFEHSILSLFGENKAAQSTGYSDAAYELIDNQPDVIFVSDKFEFYDLEYHDIFSQLDAITNGNVIFVDSIYFERPTARINELLSYISQTLHPTEEDTQDTSSDEEDAEIPDDDEENDDYYE